MFSYKTAALALTILSAAMLSSHNQETYLAEDAVAANIDEARELYYNYYYGEYYDIYEYYDYYYYDSYWDDLKAAYDYFDSYFAYNYYYEDVYSFDNWYWETKYN